MPHNIQLRIHWIMEIYLILIQLFLRKVCKISEPEEARLQDVWRDAMEEFQALDENKTWTIVKLEGEKKNTCRIHVKEFTRLNL